MLVGEQINYFKLFGFLVLRNLFSVEEVETMQDEFERGRRATLKYDPDAGSSGLTQWSNLKPESPFIASLLEDRRFLDTADQLLGGDAVAVYTNSNRRGGDTLWHPDTTDRHLLMIKNVMYLQRTTSEQGALRLIPGSHQSPIGTSVEVVILYSKN